MEKSGNRGGFIASDMGMGKTIQILLVHLCYPPKFRGKTLIIAPPGLLRQPWYKEATDSRYWGKGKNPFGKPLIFVRGGGINGKSSFPSNEEINKAELIITSYNILASHPILNQIPFRRVILDESTYIKTPTAQRSLAVRDIRCDMRWCLSGTPIENKKEDYLGQLLFLRIQPYFHQDWWYERFESDRHRMFYSTMFKRNFQNIIDGSLIEHDPIRIEMNEEEKIIYNKEKDKLIQNILGSSDMSSQGSQINKLIQLSRTINKTETLKKMIIKLLTPINKFNDIFQEGHYKKKLLSTMLLNSEKAIEYIKFGCLFPTRNSISQYFDLIKDEKEDKLTDIDEIKTFLIMFKLQVENKLKNIVFNWKYRTNHSISSNQSTNHDDDDGEDDDNSDFSSSSDDDEILVDLDTSKLDQNKIIQLNNREICCGEKCVVFVQGAKRAVEIGEILSKSCKKKVLVRASGSDKDSEKIISEFQENNNVGVLILTFRGGAHGLNLQVARNIFLVDPDWNPAILMQAIARCYRIGQTQDVHVYTFVTANSIEERVQQVIFRKIQIFRENISGVGEDITDWSDIKVILESSIQT